MNEAEHGIEIDEILLHANFVRRLAGRLAFDSHEAEDLAQDALVAAMESRARPRNLRAFLSGVVRNISRMRARSARRARIREAEVARREGLPPADQAVARIEAEERLVRAVAKLPEVYRTAIVLRYHEGLGPTAIARRLGVPARTVETRLRRGRDRLREDLGGPEHEPRGLLLALFPLLGSGRSWPSPRWAALEAAGRASATVLGGVLTMKKVAAVVALVLLLAGGSLLILDGTSPDGAPPPDEGAARIEPRHAAGTSPIAEDGKPEGERPSGCAVTGTIRDAEGNPVPGAVLLALPADLPGRIRWSGEATAAAGDDGRFALPLPRTSPLFDLVASAPGFSPAMMKRVRPGREIDLVLASTDVLTGRVRDLDGSPVAGARVAWIWRMAGSAFVLEAITRDDGGFRIEKLPSATAIHVRGNMARSCFAVDAEGYAPLTVPWSEAGWTVGKPHVDFWIGRGATVSGHVGDGETGSVLPGARVLLVLSDRPVLETIEGGGGLARIVGGERIAAEVEADEEGAFRFERIPARGFHAPGLLGVLRIGYVAAIAPGYASGVDVIQVPDEGEAVEAFPVLWPAAAITGRVVDDSGTPVAGARVMSMSEERPGGRELPVEGPFSSLGRTDETGGYRLDAVTSLRREPVVVEVYAYGTSSSNRRRRASTTIGVRAGEQAEAPDLVLADSTRGPGGTGPSVVVEVVNEAGAPIWGASLGRTPLSNEVRTSEDGIAHFFYDRHREPPGAETVVVRAPGFAPAVTLPFVPDRADPPSVRVALAPGSAIAGRAEFEDGGPVTDGTLYAVPADVRAERIFTDRGFPWVGGPAPADLPRLWILGVVATDGSGRFVLEDLPDGGVTVVLSSRSAGGRRYEKTAVACGTTDLVFRIPRPPSTLTGVLECSARDGVTGAPVPRFWVEIERADGEAGRVQRRDERPAPGKWRSAVPPGSYRVRVGAPGFVAAEREVEVPDGGPAVGLDLALSRGGTIRGRVLLPGKPDCRGSTIAFPSLEPGDESRPWCRIGADGRYQVEGLAPGRYRVELYLEMQLAGGPGIAPRRPLEIVVPEAGGVLALDVEAVEAAALEVRTEAVDGLPKKARGRIVVRDPEGRVAAEWRRYAPGNQLWLNVPPGKLIVTFEFPGRPIQATTITVAGGQRKSVEFSLR